VIKKSDPGYGIQDKHPGSATMVVVIISDTETGSETLNVFSVSYLDPFNFFILIDESGPAVQFSKTRSTKKCSLVLF
jgi:hypothetical protein